MDYVCGFMFSGASVALIDKKKGPPCVVGKLNGIGGKIESTDPGAAYAMSREFAEEAGIVTSPTSWKVFATHNLKRARSRVFFLWTTLPKGLNRSALKTMESEEVMWTVCGLPPKELAPNLDWLIPAALYGMRNNLNLDIQFDDPGFAT